MAEITKAELIESLRTTGDDLVSKLRATPAEAFEQGRYENGWNARQILAHVASIEWTYRRLVDGAQATTQAGSKPSDVAQPPPAVGGAGSQPADAARPPSAVNPPAQTNQSQPTPGSPIDDYNARQVQKRADATVAELLDEFAQNRAATIAAVEGADDALLATPTRSAGGAQGTLSAVIDFVAVQHVRAHLRDITAK